MRNVTCIIVVTLYYSSFFHFWKTCKCEFQREHVLYFNADSFPVLPAWVCECVSVCKQTDRVKDAAFWHIWGSSVKQNKVFLMFFEAGNVCQAAISCSHSIITVNGSFKIWQKQNSSSQTKTRSRHETSFKDRGCLLNVVCRIIQKNCISLMSDNLTA